MAQIVDMFKSGDGQDVAKAINEDSIRRRSRLQLTESLELGGDANDHDQRDMKRLGKKQEFKVSDSLEGKPL